MDDALKIALVLAYSYLLGSVPMAYVIGRAVKGIDIRKVGSGTVGASNVWYNVGKAWIFPLGIFDLFVKALTPVFLAELLGLDLAIQAAAGLLAVVGHNWPVFLRLHGGRGVAPTVGVLIVLARLELAVFIVIATSGWQLTRSAAFWVLIGFTILPFLALYWQRPLSIVLLLAGLLLVIVVKRLTSNTLRGTGVSLPRLMANRLLWDRDIGDSDAWVHRNMLLPPGPNP